MRLGSGWTKLPARCAKGESNFSRNGTLGTREGRKDEIRKGKKRMDLKATIVLLSSEKVEGGKNSLSSQRRESLLPSLLAHLSASFAASFSPRGRWRLDWPGLENGRQTLAVELILLGLLLESALSPLAFRLRRARGIVCPSLPFSLTQNPFGYERIASASLFSGNARNIARVLARRRRRRRRRRERGFRKHA